jgi:hypothetical protein
VIRVSVPEPARPVYSDPHVCILRVRVCLLSIILTYQVVVGYAKESRELGGPQPAPPESSAILWPITRALGGGIGIIVMIEHGGGLVGLDFSRYFDIIVRRGV